MNKLIFSKLDEALRTADLLNQGRSSPHVVLSINEPGVWQLVVFRFDEKIDYGIVWELQNDDRSLDAHDRLLLTPIKIFIHQK